MSVDIVAVVIVVDKIDIAVVVVADMPGERDNRDHATPKNNMK